MFKGVVLAVVVKKKTQITNIIKISVSVEVVKDNFGSCNIIHSEDKKPHY